MAAAIRSICRLQPFLKNFSSISQHTSTAFRKPCVYLNACKSFSSYNRLLSEMRFSKDHEWVRQEDSSSHATIGITDYAQNSLGDIVFVELPEVGAEFNQDDVIGTIESVKAVSDVFCPLTGSVTAVNTALENSPELVNSSPLDEGWLFRMQMADVSALDTLMTEKEYEKFIHDLE